MSGFSTCRSALRYGLGIACACALAHAGAQAVRADTSNFSRPLSQYLRDRWATESGFQGGAVHAITQTSDGYLWVGAEKGLFRFDGLNFRHFEPGNSTEAGEAILGVAAAPDGSLWARPKGVALFRVHKGVFQNILPDAGRPESVASALVRGRRDAMLLATVGHGVVMHHNGRFESLVTADAMLSSSFVVALAQAPNGDVWLGTRDAGLLRVRGPDVTRISTGLPDLKINCLLAGDSDDVWVGTDGGVIRWDGTVLTTRGVPTELQHMPAMRMTRDSHSVLWVAAGERGLVRVGPHGEVQSAAGPAWSLGYVATVFTDRDGNLWVGTDRGLERWRDLLFTTFSIPQGMPAEPIGPIYPDESGRVWFGPATGGLFWLRNGAVTQVTVAGLADDVVYSIHGGGGDVWVGRQKGGVTRLRVRGDGIDVTRFTQRDGLAQNSVFSVHRTRDAAVWAGTLTAGAGYLQDGKFATYDTTSGLPSNTITSIIETRDGVVWFGTPHGLGSKSGTVWRTYGLRDGLPSNEVLSLFQDRAGVLWVGTATGMAAVQGTTVKGVAHPPQLRGAILGIAEDRHGSLWVSTAERVLRVERQGLLDGTLEADDIREYGTADGLLAVESLKRNGVVAADRDGRIWFSLTRGLSVADVTRADDRSPPAAVAIEDVTADGVAMDLDAPLRIPSSRRQIAFSYNGLSLSVPERVRYRYRLDGFDSAWTDPTPNHRAVYTNLAPGRYTFRVLASNSDGLWGRTEATLPLEIEPMFWQTASFRAAILTMIALSGWSVYRLRVRQVARRLNARFEERLSERTRIAQDLHDTLLQGFISASMQLHVAVDSLPEDAPQKSSLTRVLDLMGTVIEEGRNAVRGLRGWSSAPHDLEQAFAGIQEEISSSEAAYRVVVEGRRRPLDPIVRDEVYRIGREALVNAFHHANASLIELELEYGAKELRLFVRDDGCGIEPGTIEGGREDHWGITGMRERAERMHGSFKISSRSGAGSEVELRIPAQRAFQRVRPARGWRRFAAFARKAWSRRPVNTTKPVDTTKKDP